MRLAKADCQEERLLRGTEIVRRTLEPHQRVVADDFVAKRPLPFRDPVQKRPLRYALSAQPCLPKTSTVSAQPPTSTATQLTQNIEEEELLVGTRVGPELFGSWFGGIPCPDQHAS